VADRLVKREPFRILEVGLIFLFLFETTALVIFNPSQGAGVVEDIPSGETIQAYAYAMPADVRSYLRSLHVVLCNRYYSWYYATRDQRFRVTVDTGLEYYRVKKYGNRFISKYTDHNHVVVELKYDRVLDPQADRVAGFFPFIVTRNSKYVTGIESVYL
jgi:hypothetical protein